VRACRSKLVIDALTLTLSQGEREFWTPVPPFRRGGWGVRACRSKLVIDALTLTLSQWERELWTPSP